MQSKVLHGFVAARRSVSATNPHVVHIMRSVLSVDKQRLYANDKHSCVAQIPEQASGNFARAFLAPNFRELNSLSVILITLSGCDTLPLQNRCFCNNDFRCMLMSGQNRKR